MEDVDSQDAQQPPSAVETVEDDDTWMPDFDDSGHHDTTGAELGGDDTAIDEAVALDNFDESDSDSEAKESEGELTI